MLIGEEDMMNQNELYSTTVKCCSEHAKVFCANQREIFKRIASECRT